MQASSYFFVNGVVWSEGKREVKASVDDWAIKVSLSFTAGLRSCAFLNTLTMGTAFPRVPPRNNPCWPSANPDCYVRSWQLRRDSTRRFQRGCRCVVVASFFVIWHPFTFTMRRHLIPWMYSYQQKSFPKARWLTLVVILCSFNYRSVKIVYQKFLGYVMHMTLYCSKNTGCCRRN